MPIYQLGPHKPEIDASTFIADSATIIGKVRLAANTSVWYGATLRGDNEWISIGAGSNVQEGAVMHTDPGCPLNVGENVTVGHQAMLHGCTVGNGSLIGIGAVLLNNAQIGQNCLVGAGALVTEGKVFPDNSLIIGSPAKAVRSLNEAEIANLQKAADIYIQRGADFKQQLKRLD